jgi:hypothetical protein
VHPARAVRPVGCWAPKEVPVAVEQSSGPDRLNIDGAINLETGQTVVKDVLAVDALSMILLMPPTVQQARAHVTCRAATSHTARQAPPRPDPRLSAGGRTAKTSAQKVGTDPKPDGVH